MDQPVSEEASERVNQLGPQERAVYDFLKFLAEEEKNNPQVRTEINGRKTASRVVGDFEKGHTDLPIPKREIGGEVAVTWLVSKSPQDSGSAVPF